VVANQQIEVPVDAYHHFKPNQELCHYTVDVTTTLKDPVDAYHHFEPNHELCHYTVDATTTLKDPVDTNIIGSGVHLLTDTIEWHTNTEGRGTCGSGT
jgi:hypothetical protein